MRALDPRPAAAYILALGLVCGVAFTVIFELNRTPGPSPIKVLGSVCYSLSRVSLMLFYVLLIVRLAHTERGRRFFTPWALAGRMPLTNYLMQTLLCTTLFYGWGFGLWNRVGPAACLLLAVVIFFGVQVPWSRWWLARHERGPLEALWAWLTYGRASAGAEARNVVAGRSIFTGEPDLICTMTSRTRGAARRSARLSGPPGSRSLAS